MITADSRFVESINAPVRRVKGRVELYEGSTLLNTFNATDKLKSFTIERTTDESKFFGYGICQKLTVKLRDKDRDTVAVKGQGLEAVFGTGCDYIYTNPIFYIKDISRNENTNELTLVAYDALYEAATYTFADLKLIAPYSISEVAVACAAKLGLPWQTNVVDGSFDTLYEAGANFNGTENLRTILDAIAEATQTIYFIDRNWELTFKRLDVIGNPVATINKSQYFSLENKDVYTVSAVCHTTELGDNVIAGTANGATQYVRNNPFWDLRIDVGDLVTKALAAVNGLTITQFNCSWRGNYLIEIGDKIGVTTKDGSVITSYLLDDTITYNGAMSEKTEWVYSETEGETAANPATLGDALKMTYVRVDKVNRQIELLASEEDINAAKLAALEITTDNISAKVETVQKQNDAINNDITELTKRVEATVSADDLTLLIKAELDNGITKVETATGYTFNEDGLTVSKSGSEMETKITEDGMKVYKNGSEVLTADNEGVKAIDLHATTFLVIGTNSRFENYNNDKRTACFWIGG